ncbi:MAG: hypothetical protein U5Q03_00095 [Bacteroidota bacterium]|nr:hypothetical protein [Bacteroidota bacterium]
MASNFEFIKKADPVFQGFYDSLEEAESNVYKSPRLSAITGRICLENGVRWIYDHDGSIELPTRIIFLH